MGTPCPGGDGRASRSQGDAQGSLGQLDRRLPSESPVQTLDRLDRRPITRRVRVVAYRVGPFAEQRSVRQSEGRVMLREAAGGVEPEPGRLTLRRWTETLEDARRWAGSELRGSRSGIVVEPGLDGCSLGQEL